MPLPPYVDPPPLTGADLRAWRHQHGLSLRVVGAALGLRIEAVANLERRYADCQIPRQTRAQITQMIARYAEEAPDGL